MCGDCVSENHSGGGAAYVFHEVVSWRRKILALLGSGASFTSPSPSLSMSHNSDSIAESGVSGLRSSQKMASRDPIVENSGEISSPFASVLDDYPGAKGGSGIWQTIISEMPPHDTYIEAFAGSATILRKKRPARCSLAIDADKIVCDALRCTLAGSVDVVCGDARQILRTRTWKGGELVYCDPPYLRSVRSWQGDYYAKEFATENEHVELLSILKSLPCPVIVSGYWSELYAFELQSWRSKSMNAVTRRGKVVKEFIWMNFPEPFELHDYRFLGRDFRERERIKRKKERWKNKLLKMSSLERAAVIAAIDDAAGRNVISGGAVRNVGGDDAS